MTQPFVATTFHDNEPSRVYGPFLTRDAACDWLMDNLGPTDAGVVHEMQPAQTVNGKPALTAEAWMLVRMIKAMATRNPLGQLDVMRVISHLNKQYGTKQLYAAIDAINQEYRR